MPSLNDCGWNSHGDSDNAAIANQTCHVVMAKTYCAPYRETSVSITVCAAIVMDGVTCEDAYAVYRSTKLERMFMPRFVDL